MAQFIKPAEGRLTSFYGRRKHPITGKMAGHHGIDIAKAGTVPVLATADGTVRWARSDGLGGSYGNVVTIKHAGGWESLYAHLARYTVRAGQTVKQGQIIGYMGNTGGSTGQHLHFELHKGGWNASYSNEVNPLSYYQDPDVKALQESLNTVGIPVDVDSYFGPATERAVRIFQSRKGLEVDGSAGPATMTALDKTVAEKQAQTAAKPKPTPAPAPAPKPTPPEKEMDELDQRLPLTQQKDMANLLRCAHQTGVFEVDHSDKASTMTRRQAYDLTLSYVARKAAKEFEK